MNGVELFVFAFIFLFVLLYALLPGLVMGILIGLFVRSKRNSWKWCLVVSGIASTTFIIVARSELSLAIVPIWTALLPWIFLGRWFGRILLPPDAPKN